MADSYTLQGFIAEQPTDEITYRNFAILEKSHGLEILDRNLVMDYIREFLDYSVILNLSLIEYNKYRYAPDLLAYDVYGSIQLDFIIMFLNDMVDPKEFDLRKVKMLKYPVLNDLLSIVYSNNIEYLRITRDQNDLKIIE